MEVEAAACMGERLAAAEMFWVHLGNSLGSAKGLGSRLAGRWNELVLHYDDSETGKYGGLVKPIANWQKCKDAIRGWLGSLG